MTCLEYDMHLSHRPLILGEEILLELSKNIYPAKMDALDGETITTNRTVTCSWLTSILTKTIHHELLPCLDLCSDTEVVLIFLFIAFPLP